MSSTEGNEKVRYSLRVMVAQTNDRYRRNHPRTF